MTPNEKQIAAGIIETGRATLNRDSSPDYLTAAAWVFDNGVFFLTPRERQSVIDMLRAHPTKGDERE